MLLFDIDAFYKGPANIGKVGQRVFAKSHRVDGNDRGNRVNRAKKLGQVE